MRIHKTIEVKNEEIEKAIVHKDLIKRAVYSIEQYNERKKRKYLFQLYWKLFESSRMGILIRQRYKLAKQVLYRCFRNESYNKKCLG